MAKLANKHTSGTPIGTIQPYAGSTAPAGNLLCDGKTIGNALSGATSLANDRCYALFVQLYNSFANTELAVSGGRTGNAAADWASGKTITLPDLRGRVPVGKDNLGGTAINRVTVGGSNIAGTTLGASGGDQTVAQHNHTSGSLATSAHTKNETAHTHGQNRSNGVAGGLNGELVTGAYSGSVANSWSTAGATTTNLNISGDGTNSMNGHTMSGSTASTGTGIGSSSNHGNMMPSLIIGYMIAYI
jgi:microcystin-dependent protein